MTSFLLKLGKFSLFDDFFSDLVKFWDLNNLSLFDFLDLYNFLIFSFTNFLINLSLPLILLTLLVINTLLIINILLIANIYDNMIVFYININNIAILLNF